MRLRVFAMARPARSTLERALVRQAAEGMRGSARARALCIARRVVAEVVAFVDRDPADELDAALVAARAVIAPTPAFLLATVAEIGTTTPLLDARAARFAARGCRQLGPAEWAAETRAVAAELQATLAERYRRHLTEKAGGNSVSTHAERAAA